MISKSDVTLLLADYLTQYPVEAERCAIFSDYLLMTGSDELYDRSNFNGHITTSAFIVNAERREMLLLRHKSLGRWLQPGGHFEGDSSLAASALREAEEESGIPGTELKLFTPFMNAHTPFDIDSHYIPANPKKAEEGHYHHDVRYLFLYRGNGEANYNEEEATGMKWVSFTELTDDPTFGMMIIKIKNTLTLDTPAI